MFALIILAISLSMMVTSTLVVFAACVLAKRQTNPQIELGICQLPTNKQKDYEQVSVHSPNGSVYSLSKAR